MSKQTAERTSADTQDDEVMSGGFTPSGALAEHWFMCPMCVSEYHEFDSELDRNVVEAGKKGDFRCPACLADAQFGSDERLSAISKMLSEAFDTPDVLTSALVQDLGRRFRFNEATIIRLLAILDLHGMLRRCQGDEDLDLDDPM